MARHLLYIINKYSGTGNWEKLEADIKKITAKQGLHYTIDYSEKDIREYARLFPLIKEKGVTDIIIAGGDGTVNQAIQAFKHLDVNFGIIPRGSGNGLAFAAKIKKNLSKALDVVFKGNALPVDAFYVNDQFSCMLSGLGFDAKVAHDFANQPKRGFMTYAKQVGRNFFSAQPYSFSIQSPNYSFDVDAFFLCIANSNQFGNHVKIAPKARLDDGLLDIVIVTNQNKLNFLLQTLKQLTGFNHLQTGKLINNKRIIYFQTDELTILNKSQAPLHIDGEPTQKTSDQFKIRIEKGCFRLLGPQGQSKQYRTRNKEF